MSRSGYSDDYDDDSSVHLWQGAVRSALRGKRGQAFLREMATALDAMPCKRLIANDLVDENGECCAIGSVALARGLNVDGIEATDPWEVAETFGVAPAMVQEIAYLNDEWADYARSIGKETPEGRWRRMRAWVDEQLRGNDPEAT